MIQPLSAASSTLELSLPQVITAESASINSFGTVYAANTAQFATRETADALAAFLGGEVINLADQWGGGYISPLYQVEVGGVSLNAGLLADRFRRYGTEAAMEMTQVELGFPIQRTSRTAPAASGTAPVSNANSIPAVSPAVVSPSHTAAAVMTDPDAGHKKLAAAAQQFESLLMGQILKSAVPDGEDDPLGGGADSPSQSIYQLALENFATALAQQGGLGLASSMVDQLKLKSAKTSMLG